VRGDERKHPELGGLVLHVRDLNTGFDQSQFCYVVGWSRVALVNASLLAFLPVALLLVVTPGVNNLVVIGSTVGGGVRGGALATAGTSLGVLVWAAAVALGLGALVTASPPLWVAVQWAGACWLVVLGARSLLSSRRAAPESGTAGRRVFTDALATGLLNPRAGVVAVAVLPQFVPPGAPIATTTLVLGVTWAGLAALWNLVGVALVARGRRLFAGPAGRRVVEVVAGVVMMLTGVSVVLGG
jgi:threonine/homoserine/homoserine lactone efflux protein